MVRGGNYTCQLMRTNHQRSWFELVNGDHGRLEVENVDVAGGGALCAGLALFADTRAATHQTPLYRCTTTLC